MCCRVLADIPHKFSVDTVNRLADDPELLRLMSENAAKLSKRDAAGKILREITELMGIK